MLYYIFLGPVFRIELNTIFVDAAISASDKNCQQAMTLQQICLIPSLIDPYIASGYIRVAACPEEGTTKLGDVIGASTALSPGFPIVLVKKAGQIIVIMAIITLVYYVAIITGAFRRSSTVLQTVLAKRVGSGSRHLTSWQRCVALM